MRCSRKGASTIAAEPPFRALTPHAHEAIDNLTPRQRAYLKLVAEGYQTKEIARQLSVSPDRVNKVMSLICGRLGTETRREAGRFYGQWERATLSDPPTHWVGPHSVGLGQPGDAMSDGAAVKSAAATDQQIPPLAEEQTSYSLPQAPPGLLDLMPLRRSGRPTNDLTMHSTLMLIAKLAVGALIAVGSALSLLSSMAAFIRG